jgi:transcriptional regulator
MSFESDFDLAKRKLSQNRPAADIEGVITGLRAKGDLESAADVERAQPDPAPGN